MKDDASSPDGPPLPLPGEAGQPALIAGQPALIIKGLACLDEWDTLALARLPLRNLLRKAMRWGRVYARLS
jgi:hypothetical protein